MEKDKNSTNNTNLVGMDFFKVINQIFAPPFPRVPDVKEDKKPKDDEPIKSGAD